MQLPMVTATERHGEFIADFEAGRPRLGSADGAGHMNLAIPTEVLGERDTIDPMSQMRALILQLRP